MQRLAHAGLGFVRQPGRNLQTDETIPARATIVHRSKNVGGSLNILTGQSVENLLGTGALLRVRADGGIVIIAARDRLLENGRVGGQSGDVACGHHARQLP